jgi:hypothetical protein
MNNENKNLNKIATKVVNELNLVTFISSGLFLGYGRKQYSQRDIQRAALKYATNDFEQTYIFINRVVKQIKLILS